MTEPALNEERCTVAVVGGGTSGLALAAELRKLGVDDVVVLERENEAGGIPRHCGHYPFGLREYGRLLKGPHYARRNVASALAQGVDIRTGATVVGLREGGLLEVSSDQRRYLLRARRVVLCTGVRESSRAQRFIGGDRPAGVISTGALQNLSYLKNIRPFRRAVILGSELVSFSAIQTCRHLGVKPVAMVEEQDRIVARRILQPYLWLQRVPLETGVRDLRIVGKGSVEALSFRDGTGRARSIECDGIVVSGRFRPESALLRLGHLAVDPKSGGPIVDQFGRASDPAYFCTGNILRPAETSGFCWHEGVETARRIHRDLNRDIPGGQPSIPVVADHDDLAFVVPQRISPDPAADGMASFYIGLKRPVKGRITLSGQDGKKLWTGKLNARPVRRIQIPIPPQARDGSHTQLTVSVER